MRSIHSVQRIAAALVFLVACCTIQGLRVNTDVIIRLTPTRESMTDVIQRSIDKCASLGGGTIIFSEGLYISGAIELRSNVVLQLDKGAILQGSNRDEDYKNDAFIYGADLTNVAIKGAGVIDGVDCNNPNGEEGFRGPHCIRLTNCKKIVIDGITIKNSANWAMNFRYCDQATITRVSIRGGHDGLHTRFCSNFKVSHCDFRTGDDAFAGNDNHDFIVTDCNVNTSCNGFRFGCLNFKLDRCKFWGPGEYPHKSQKRTNMLSAFVHFSPEDENPKLKSGNWSISDVTIENVDHVYMYNFEKGLWQTGQPVTSVKFERINASQVLGAFSIIGDSALSLIMTVNNSSFSFREGTPNPDTFEGAQIRSTAFFHAFNFNQIKLTNITLRKKNGAPIIQCATGHSLILDGDNLYTGGGSRPFIFEGIQNLQKTGLKEH